MWIQRTPDEVSQWQKDTEKQARADGLMMGVMIWAVVVVLLSTGWVLIFQVGMGAQSRWGGRLGTGLPIFALLASPVIFIVRHYAEKKALRKAAGRTICPQCGSGGNGNAGATCKCGGTFVVASTMKWVEK